MAASTDRSAVSLPLRMTWEQAHTTAAVAHLTGMSVVDVVAARDALLERRVPCPVVVVAGKSR